MTTSAATDEANAPATVPPPPTRNPPPPPTPSAPPPSLPIESSDVLRLIMQHLTECGLHGACRTLREESGVGAAGVPHHGLLRGWARDGRWGDVLECVEGLDPERIRGFDFDPGLVADVHEMSMLECAAVGEVDLAYAALRVASDDLDEVPAASVIDGVGEEKRSMSIERRIAALSSLRSLHGVGRGGAGSSSTTELIPPDYYGPDNISRQKRRDEIGRRLADAVPVVPPSRLVSLLQQAVKWQAHTGQLPMVKELWDDDEDDDGGKGRDADGEGRKSKKKKKKKRRKKKFDLVLGEVDAVAASEGGDGDGIGQGSAKGGSSKNYEKIPSRPLSTIKFGKKSYVECATFLPDGSGLVTGSSDGFVEIWDPDSKYTELRTHDLAYQEADELLMHDTAILALTVSNDGTMLGTGSSDGMIKVWKIDNGKCLRQFDKAHGSAVSCLAFSNDGSHVLSGSHDTTCREFGLRAARMLKEFRGHGSYVNTCAYVMSEGGPAGSRLLVVTGSADGSVRVWDGRSAEVRHVLQPTSVSATTDVGGMSVAASMTGEDVVGGRNVHTVIPLHTPSNAMIVVPRCPRAYLMSYSGTILRTFERDDGKGINKGNDTKADFVAANVSPSNKWLYVATEDGLLFCYDVATGKIEKTVRDFGEECSGSESAEISGLVHHAHKTVLGGYSNDKGQKRGLLTLWK